LVSASPKSDIKRLNTNQNSIVVFGGGARRGGGGRFIYYNHRTYPLERGEREGKAAIPNEGMGQPACRLIARKEQGIIEVDTTTTLRGVPAEAWEYRLGTYSALEWILERYKEKKPKDPTIAEKFNTYRFADYKESVIDLLMRVCTVSVETMKVVKEMPI
jgi:predicted helicase